MADFHLKVGDTLPKYRRTLRGSDGAVQDLTGATSVKFRMRKMGTTGAYKVDAAAVVIDAPNGLVEYAWVAADTDTPGSYHAEWQVFWGANRQTHPNDNHSVIQINPTA